jgi:ribosomal protein S18 acetylase RimI-like enzyme
VVPERAWYLSILAVAPKAQGRGMGRELLRPTLAEADAREAPTYVETSTPRNLRFYQREGFRVELSYREPVSGADYWVLVRPVGG